MGRHFADVGIYLCARRILFLDLVAESAIFLKGSDDGVILGYDVRGALRKVAK